MPSPYFLELQRQLQHYGLGRSGPLSQYIGRRSCRGKRSLADLIFSNSTIAGPSRRTQQVFYARKNDSLIKSKPVVSAPAYPQTLFMAGFVTRFAPSPTGLLHLGHAFSALAAFEAAKAADGRLLLRIEDIDQARCKPEFEKAIYEDLAWLGISWEGPARRQSEHFNEYKAVLAILREKGVVYRCFKTRKEIAEEIARAPHFSPDGPDGASYVGAPLAALEERSLLADGKSYAWRLSISAARDHLGGAFEELAFTEEGAGPNGETGRLKAMPEIFGDPVIARKDFGTSYHLASVHDDARAGVTHVIRGQDLFHAAHLHVLVYALLDFPAPVYRCHKLITDKTGKRLAKRDESVKLRALRESGSTREDILSKLGFSGT